MFVLLRPEFRIKVNNIKNYMDIASNKSLWSLSATNIDGDEIDPLQKLADGKKCVMIVNVASL